MENGTTIVEVLGMGAGVVAMAISLVTMALAMMRFMRSNNAKDLEARIPDVICGVIFFGMMTAWKIADVLRGHDERDFMNVTSCIALSVFGTVLLLYVTLFMSVRYFEKIRR